MKLKMGAGIVLMLIGSGLIGCSDDTPADPFDPVDPPGEVIRPPTNPDVLVNNFKISLQDMDSSAFSSLLHDDFRLVILEPTITSWAESDHPLSELYFDSEQTVSNIGRLFEGLAGADQIGMVVSPIESISVSVLDKQDAWEPIGEEVDYFSEYPEVYSSNFNILFHFYMSENSRYEVAGMMEIIVIPTVEGDGSDWQILGLVQHGVTVSKATESITFAGLLCYYRSLEDSES